MEKNKGREKLEKALDKEHPEMIRYLGKLILKYWIFGFIYFMTMIILLLAINGDILSAFKYFLMLFEIYGFIGNVFIIILIFYIIIYFISKLLTKNKKENE